MGGQQAVGGKEQAEQAVLALEEGSALLQLLDEGGAAEGAGQSQTRVRGSKDNKGRGGDNKASGENPGKNTTKPGVWIKVKTRAQIWWRRWKPDAWRNNRTEQAGFCKPTGIRSTVTTHTLEHQRYTHQRNDQSRAGPGPGARRKTRSKSSSYNHSRTPHTHLASTANISFSLITKLNE